MTLRSIDTLFILFVCLGLPHRVWINETLVAELIREERYIFSVGTKEHVLRAQELVRGSTGWPERFRVQVQASFAQEGKTFYGTTAREAVELAIQYISAPLRRAGTSSESVGAPN